MRRVLWPVSVGLAAVLVVSLALGLEGAWHEAKRPAAPGGAQQPCAPKQPSAATPAAAVNDKVAETTFKAYTGWTKVNEQPVLSETHGNRWVFTYLNKTAAGAGLGGKFPFPPGSILAKESYENEGGKPGVKGPLFVMEKRKKGYDAANRDWYYAIVSPDGAVAMSGSGRQGAPTAFCAACHRAAKVNDYVFGSGTILKVKPVRLGGAPAQPCAPKQPCAPRR